MAMKHNRKGYTVRLKGDKAIENGPVVNRTEELRAEYEAKANKENPKPKAQGYSQALKKD